jgi:hypothetical protein
MLLTYTTLQLLGYTLNMIVLFSLIMAVGMVVDNAIVMVENIYRHYQLSGPPHPSRHEGRRRGRLAGHHLDADDRAAFAPMVFWPGIMGGFMKYLPITLIIALLSSLLIALVVNPMLSSIFVTREKTHGPSRFMHGYRRLLATALEHRFTTLCLAVLLLVGLVILYGKQGHGVELFPEFDPRRAIIDIRCPQGTNIRETDRLARTIEQRLQPFAADLERVITTSGTAAGGRATRRLGGRRAPGQHRPDFPRLRNPPPALDRGYCRDSPSYRRPARRGDQGPEAGGRAAHRGRGHGPPGRRGLQGARKPQRTGPQSDCKCARSGQLRSDHEAARPELAFAGPPPGDAAGRQHRHGRQLPHDGRVRSEGASTASTTTI